MKRTLKHRLLPLVAVLVALVLAFGTTAFASGDPTEEPDTKMIECSDCGATGMCMTCYGHDEECSDCGGSGECASCEGTGYGRVLDLILPVLVLVISCIIGMIYSGGFFDGVSVVEAFSNSDASVGLMLGSAVALVITILYYLLRHSLKFTEMMACIPEGFKAMVPAILILTFAWSLKAMTDSLGAKVFVRDFVYANAQSFQSFLPAIVFVIGCLLAFATGTSWGTFGILIPIVQSVFPMGNPLAIVCISACMAGAVCGDHCSPISDTTIMASAGAQCDHVNHVSTQLPYAITVAAVSFVTYIIAGFLPTAAITLPVGIALMIVTLLVIRTIQKNKISI